MKTANPFSSIKRLAGLACLHGAVSAEAGSGIPLLKMGSRDKPAKD